MKQPAEPQVGASLAFLILTAFCASLALWGWIARRALCRQPVVPWQPRRPVPWRAVDLLAIFAVHVVVAGAVVDLDRFLFPEVAALAAQAGDQGKPTTEHEVLVLLREEPSLAALVVCLLAAVVVAPVTEEVFFRLLLQGWLERAERSWRGFFRIARGLMRGWAPVLASSVAFAALHSRTASLPPSPRVLFHVLVCSSIVKLGTTGFAVAWVRWRVGATWEDLGFQRGELRRDLLLGLGAALATIPWIYVLQWALTQLLPETVSPDPFTLTPFAMVLGLLYYRTHRIVPCVVLHMALNAASLALAWAVL